jgi:hypothetical protein
LLFSISIHYFKEQTLTKKAREQNIYSDSLKSTSYFVFFDLFLFCSFFTFNIPLLLKNIGFDLQGYYSALLIMRKTRLLIKNIASTRYNADLQSKAKLNKLSDLILGPILDCNNPELKFFPKASGCSRGVVAEFNNEKFLIKTYNGLNNHLSRFSGDTCILPDRQLCNDDVTEIFSSGFFNERECFDEFLAMRHLAKFYSYLDCNIHTDRNHLLIEHNFSKTVRALYVKSLSPWKIDQDSALYNTSIKGKLRKIVKKTFWIEASLGAYDFLHQIAYTNEEAFHRIDTFGDKDEKSLKTKTLNMFFPPDELLHFSCLLKKSTSDIPKALLSAYGLRLFKFSTKEMLAELDYFIEYVAQNEKVTEEDQATKLKLITLDDKLDYTIPTLSELKNLKKDLIHYAKEEFLDTLIAIAEIYDINHEQKLLQKKIATPYLEELHRKKKKFANQEATLMR